MENNTSYDWVEERSRRIDAEIAARVDGRMRELGLATADEYRPGEPRYYGYSPSGDPYEEHAQDYLRAAELGEMADGSYRTPAVGAAAFTLEQAEADYSQYSDVGTTAQHLDELRAKLTTAREDMETALHSETSVQDQLEDRLAVYDDALEHDDGLEP